MMQTQLERTDTVILVAFKLPLKVRRTETGWAAEWDEDSVLNKEALNLPIRAIWVGRISLETEPKTNRIRRRRRRRIVLTLSVQVEDE